ncbi:MAG: NAD-dependent epimerase/dehydratase family protein [Acidobacteria bacterium]|nr:MAG: NAD-dependent epimerase/dehydratase family protein [Acidobacteriota bacterium]REK02932.1 MAG: NAD-dependent epimerase/dehydratase family protein [Acidobacteriota bacterium]REK13264.1 MAG: NAD-dependent epimerase/dehydratase family protein [Acidobacteriota bacterium]REK41258.1 MAG: NAD-dependent epimerase/dehydratase family protein [Acidobacteriota bacterium]
MSTTKKIFVTGFPGFLAGRLVERLAGPDVEFFLLVQEQFFDKAMKDIAEISERTGTPAKNFAVIGGDITEVDLGMNEADVETVIRETTDVFHLAAIYDLAVEKELAYKVNVKGTEYVSDLVRRMPKLHRYNYISTCYVAGKRDDRIFENELEHDEGFRNYYEETKYFAELEVEALKNELPVTIFRPSVVCGDSKTGETAKYDGIYYVIKFLLRFPEVFRLVNVGNEDVKLNLVPVDFVVEGMAALSEDENAVGKTVALADPKPLTTKALCDSIAESITNKKSVITPPAKVVEKFLKSSISPSITGLPHPGVPYFFIPQTYDTSVMEELLEPHGVECPRFEDYVKNLVAFVEAHPKL